MLQLGSTRVAKPPLASSLLLFISVPRRSPAFSLLLAPKLLDNSPQLQLLQLEHVPVSLHRCLSL